MKRLLVVISFFVAGFTSAAEPFPSDMLTGVWKMTKNYTTETDIGRGTSTELNHRTTITLAFLDGGRCRLTVNEIDKNFTQTLLCDYVNDVFTIKEIENLERGKYDLDATIVGLKASRFTLIKVDDDTFEMKYLDLDALNRSWMPIASSCVSEYLADGRLKVKHSMDAGGLRLTTIELHPPMIFKRVGDLVLDATIENADSLYKVLSCEKEKDCDFAYRFTIEVQRGSGSKLKMFRRIQQEFSTAIYEDYAKSFGGEAASLFVEFPEFKMTGWKIEGRAVVLGMAVQSLSYNPETRTGRISISLRANQFDVARRYIRKNIEALACKSNIVAVNGERPPPGRFYIGREVVKDGGVLEVDFKTE